MRAASWRRALDRLVAGSRLVCELVLVGMALLIAAEVVLRSLFGRSLMLTDEVAGYLLVALAFLALGVALREGALFRVDFLYLRLPERGRHGLSLLFDLLSLGFAVLLDWQLVRLVVSSYEREMVAPTLLGTPLWLPQLVMPAGATLLVLALAGAVADDLAALRRGPAGRERRP